MLHVINQLVGSQGIEDNLLPLPYDVLNEEFAIFDLVYKPNPTPLITQLIVIKMKINDEQDFFVLEILKLSMSRGRRPS